MKETGTINGPLKGFLRIQDGKPFIMDASGNRLLYGKTIWSGYTEHWLNRAVQARYLPQKDYETGQPIIIMWPDVPDPGVPFVELYYNERLVKYPKSLLGHIAININGEIFNFSHLLNENEVMTPEEYFYRPALGEFAPHPELGVFNVDDREHPYYDKFGRNFMRTIHVLRLEGLDTGRISRYFHEQLKIIHSTRPDPKRPDHYRDFSIFTRSCSTIIRDGLRDYGFKSISGMFPHDLFVNTAYHLINKKDTGGLTVKLLRMKQLKVPEASFSALTPFINPLNRILAKRIPAY